MSKKEIYDWLKENWQKYLYEGKLFQCDLHKAVRENLNIPDGVHYDYWIEKALDDIFSEINDKHLWIILMY